MAADEERPKKKTDRGVKKLLPGEDVEVLCSEDGLNGSWHSGIIVDCVKFSRTVELANLLNEDSRSKLVDLVPVTAAIEGLKKSVSKSHRNSIRPLPPKHEIKATKLVYGLCVDASVDDAWWEGVVFDHNEGSSERLIFFPDQGDQQVVSIEKLRATQDWNEASGLWKHRGVWKFIKIVKKLEKEGPLPVSVRELWYDLRSMASFSEKIGMWISGSKSIWYELVTELIQELQCVVYGLPVNVDTSYGTLYENTLNFDVSDCPGGFLPVSYGDLSPETAGLCSGFANNFPALLDPNGKTSCRTHVDENHAPTQAQIEDSRKNVIISSSCNEPNSKQYPNFDVKKHDFSFKGASFDGIHCKSHDSCQDMAQTSFIDFNTFSKNSEKPGDGSKDNSSGITALGPSFSWKVMNLEAENCAEAIPLYLHDLQHGNGEPRREKVPEKRLNSLRLKAKRHLVALGWNIEARRECGKLRIRFVSPHGQCYYSLRHACFRLLLGKVKKNRKQKFNKSKSLDETHLVTSHGISSMNSGGEKDGPPSLKKHQMEVSSNGIELKVSEGDTKPRTNPQRSCRLSDDRIVNDEKASFDFIDERRYNSRCSFSDRVLLKKIFKQGFPVHKDIKPEDIPGAIPQYISYKNSKGMVDKKPPVADISLMILNAKKHLLFMGWSFWKVNAALFYVSPSGKSFHSLFSACKGFVEDDNPGVGTSRTVINGKIRRRLEYMSKEMKPVNISKKLLRRVCCCSTAMADQNFHETSKVLQNGVEKKFIDSSKSLESTACNFSQMPSNECRGSKRRRITSSSCQYLDQELLRHSACCFSACAKPEKRKTLLPHAKKRRSLTGSSACRVRRSSKRSRDVDAVSASTHVSRTVLSLLIENDVVLPRQKVKYISKSDGHVMMEGRITREGIKCKCCAKVYSLSNFESHAGSTLGRPAANIFLKDGRSLLQCQIQMVSSKIPEGFHRSRSKSDSSIYPSDSICSVCHDGGSLILCDHCPSSFHIDCVGLKDVPEDNWFCPSCRCHVCGVSEFNPDIEKFTDKTMLHCDQCEHEYHAGCMREKRWKSLQACPSGNWFCSRSCSEIFHSLRKLLGISKPTTVEGLSCTILRSGRDYRASCDQFDSEVQAEHYSKLCVALKVLNECFVSIIEPRTQSDIVADILFNKESELKRLNFYGFYAMLLEKGDELISVATFRIYGDKIAEMPLIGTRIKYRRQGMCRLLVGEIEKLLVSIGVERFLLPAVPQLLETWTTSFGFVQLSSADRLNLLDYTLLNFQDTTMCQKVLRVVPKAKPKDNFNSVAGNINSDNLDRAPKYVLALPCFDASGRPVLAPTKTSKRKSTQTSHSHSVDKQCGKR